MYRKRPAFTFFIIICQLRTYIFFKVYNKYSLYVKKQNKRIHIGNQWISRVHLWIALSVDFCCVFMDCVRVSLKCICGLCVRVCNPSGSAPSHRAGLEPGTRERESLSQSSVCAHHTPATGGEEREREPIKCIRSPHTSYRWRGERERANQVYALTTHQLQVERRESHRANQVYALTTHQLQVERRERERESQSSVCAHHTPATGGEEREREPIKCTLSPHTSYRWRGERERERERANQVYALTTHQLQVERRESHRAIKWMEIIRRP